MNIMDKRQLIKILSWNISTEPEIKIDYVLEQLRQFTSSTNVSSIIVKLGKMKDNGLEMAKKEELIEDLEALG